MTSAYSAFDTHLSVHLVEAGSVNGHDTVLHAEVPLQHLRIGPVGRLPVLVNAAVMFQTSVTFIGEQRFNSHSFVHYAGETYQRIDRVSCDCSGPYGRHNEWQWVRCQVVLVKLRINYYRAVHLRMNIPAHTCTSGYQIFPHMHHWPNFVRFLLMRFDVDFLDGFWRLLSRLWLFVIVHALVERSNHSAATGFRFF